jgi:hypothetical protein
MTHVEQEKSNVLPLPDRRAKAYSRARALREGLLVDATELAQKTGITCPLALTSAVYWQCVTLWSIATGLNPLMRLWNIVWRCGVVDLQLGRSTRSFSFDVHTPRRGTTDDCIVLLACRHRGDDGEPVMTIMWPSQAG